MASARPRCAQRAAVTPVSCMVGCAAGVGAAGWLLCGCPGGSRPCGSRRGYRHRRARQGALSTSREARRRHRLCRRLIRRPAAGGRCGCQTADTCRQQSSWWDSDCRLGYEARHARRGGCGMPAGDGKRGGRRRRGLGRVEGGDGKGWSTAEPRRQGSEFCASPAPPHSARAGPTPGRLRTIWGATCCATNSFRIAMRRGVFMYAHLRFSSPYPAATLCPPPREGLQGAQFSPRRDADDALGLFSVSGGRPLTDTARVGSPTRAMPRLARAARRAGRPSFARLYQLRLLTSPRRRSQRVGAGKLRGSRLRCARPRPRATAVGRSRQRETWEALVFMVPRGSGSLTPSVGLCELQRARSARAFARQNKKSTVPTCSPYR